MKFTFILIYNHTYKMTERCRHILYAKKGQPFLVLTSTLFHKRRQHGTCNPPSFSNVLHNRSSEVAQKNMNNNAQASPSAPTAPRHTAKAAAARRRTCLGGAHLEEEKPQEAFSSLGESDVD